MRWSARYAAGLQGSRRKPSGLEESLTAIGQACADPYAACPPPPTSDSAFSMSADDLNRCVKRRQGDKSAELGGHRTARDGAPLRQYGADGGTRLPLSRCRRSPRTPAQHPTARSFSLANDIRFLMSPYVLHTRSPAPRRLGSHAANLSSRVLHSNSN